MNARARAAGRVLLCAGAAALFLALWCRFFGGLWPWQIYLPASWMNDEVLYNRQLAAVLDGLAPRGFFGYNESTAAVGRFGAWGPVLFYLYAVPGLLAGRGVNGMLWCNVLLAVAGWVVLVRGAASDWRAQAVLGAALALLRLPLYYVFSGMSEALHYALVLGVVGAALAVRRGAKHPRAWYAALCACAAAETLVRPYGAVFFLFPLALLGKPRRGGAYARRAGLLALGAALCLAASLVSMLYLTAPYFDGGAGLDLTPLYALRNDGPAAFLAALGGKLGGVFTDCILPDLQNGTASSGLPYLAFFFAFALCLGVLVRDARRGRPCFAKACMLVCAGLIFAALLTLYYNTANDRHCLLLALALLAALLAEDGARAVPSALLIGALAAGVLLMPTADAEIVGYDAVIDENLGIVAAALTEAEADNDSADPWDHTLAYSFMDSVFHGYLYAVPAGMGVQFDRNAELADTENPIRSRYVLTAAGSDVEARLLAEGWRLLAESSKFELYEKGAG